MSVDKASEEMPFEKGSEGMVSKEREGREDAPRGRKLTALPARPSRLSRQQSRTVQSPSFSLTLYTFRILKDAPSFYCFESHSWELPSWLSG